MSRPLILFSEPVIRRKNFGTEQMLAVSHLIGQSRLQQEVIRDDENGDDDGGNRDDGPALQPAPPAANGGGPAPPPPPPPPPAPPRPGFWRFPEAEFANKVWHR